MGTIQRKTLEEISSVWRGTCTSPLWARTCLHRSPNLIGDGLNALLTGALTRFNAQFASRRGGPLLRHLENEDEDESFDVNRDEEDAKGVPLLNLEIR
jgi:hypothetical protein